MYAQCVITLLLMFYLDVLHVFCRVKNKIPVRCLTFITEIGIYIYIYIYIYMCNSNSYVGIFKESLQGTHWTLRLIRIGSSSSVYTSGSQFQSSRPAYFVCYSYHFRCLFYSNVSALRSGHHRIFRHDSSSKRTYIYSIKSVLKCARRELKWYMARGLELRTSGLHKQPLH